VATHLVQLPNEVKVSHDLLGQAPDLLQEVIQMGAHARLCTQTSPHTRNSVSAHGCVRARTPPPPRPHTPSPSRMCSGNHITSQCFHEVSMLTLHWICKRVGPGIAVVWKCLFMGSIDPCLGVGHGMARGFAWSQHVRVSCLWLAGPLRFWFWSRLWLLPLPFALPSCSTLL
jgi:hypothetical protein